MKKTVIFDMHGVVFCYSPDFDISKSDKLFEEKIKQYSKSVAGCEQAWQDYQNGDFSLVLKIEKESVLKGIAGDSSELQVYEMPRAMDRIIQYYNKGYNVVFIATAEVETTKGILRLFLRRQKNISSKKALAAFDIINMNQFGSKKDPQAWKKVLEPYKNISEIYEDKQKYLEAAGVAAGKLGSIPRLHTSVEG